MRLPGPADRVCRSYLHVVDAASRYVFAADAIWAVEGASPLALDNSPAAADVAVCLLGCRKPGVDAANGVDAADQFLSGARPALPMGVAPEAMFGC